MVDKRNRKNNDDPEQVVPTVNENNPETHYPERERWAPKMFAVNSLTRARNGDELLLMEASRDIEAVLWQEAVELKFKHRKRRIVGLI